MSKPMKNIRHLTNDEKSGIKRAFEFLDTDRDGYLDYHETKAAMRALGFDVKKSQVSAIMRANDKTEGNKIGFEDFYYISTSSIIAHQEDCRKIITLFKPTIVAHICPRHENWTL